MPIQLASYLIPRNNGAFYLLEDTYLKGGFRVTADVTSRDAIPAPCLKNGMLCYTVAENKFWKYNSVSSTWEVAKFSTNNSYDNTTLFPDAADRVGTVCVAADTKKPYVSNGSEWVELATKADIVIPYDIALNVYGKSTVANDVIASFLAIRNIALTTGTGGGVAKCGVAPTAGVSLTLKNNADVIGTVTFAAGSTTGVVNIIVPTTLVNGSLLTLSNQATPDTTMEDVAITIKGSYQ